MVVGPRPQRLSPALAEPDSLSIGELYSRIARAVDRALPREVWVSGEVRSSRVSSRGHCYLELADPVVGPDGTSPILKVKCWATTWRSVRSSLQRLGLSLEAGLVVRVRGRVDLYTPRGEIGFVLSALDTDALLGKVAAARARLVAALVDEGLFERNRRLAMPPVPLTVGLVCSPSTEGYRDFVGQLEASGMGFRVRTAATQVQGRRAPASVAAAITRLQPAGCDVIVVVRGGGSKADLATFDAEPVARAVATSQVPVWTGIGHTGDLSITDEVAHRSFVTPTECGQELARLVTDFWRTELRAGLAACRLARDLLGRAEDEHARRRRATATGVHIQLDRHTDRLVHSARTLRSEARGQLESHRHQLAAGVGSLARCARGTLRSEESSLLGRSVRLGSLPERRLEVEAVRAAHWRQLLGAYDYHRQLERGYSVTRDDSGSIVRSIAGMLPGSHLTTQVADGVVGSEVTAVGADVDPRHAPEDEGEK